MSNQHPLDLFEGLGVDENGVLALVLDTAPRHIADVVAVPQDLVKLA